MLGKYENFLKEFDSELQRYFLKEKEFKMIDLSLPGLYD